MLQLTKPETGLTLAVYAFAFAVITIMGSQQSVAIVTLTVDPASLSSLPFYAGILSNVGIMFWTATAVICLFTSTLTHVQREPRLFLLAAGTLTLLLMFDDQFMLHEEVFPKYLHLPSVFLYGIYAVGMLAIALFFYRPILAFNPILVMLPFSFFAASFSANAIGQNVLTTVNPLLLEDGSKFIGIMGWFLYFVLFSHKAAQRRPE